MIERIKRLTNFQEGILVITIALGLFIYSSIRGLLIISTGTSKKWTYLISENGSIGILVTEVIALAIIAFILYKRGWKFSELNLHLSSKIFFQGVMVLLINLLIGGLVTACIVYVIDVDRESLRPLVPVPHKNYFIWGLVLVINSFFEEFIYVGYLFKKLGNQNKGLFIILSSTLRVIIHLYQGLFAIIPHLITGLIFGTYYTKHRQLTTLIIAHGLFNLLVLWRTS